MENITKVLMVGLKVSSTYKLSQPTAMNRTSVKFISFILAICQIVFLDSSGVKAIKQITDKLG